MISILAAGVSQACEFAALHGRCFTEGWSAAAFEGFLRSTDSIALLATAAGGPCGLALLQVAADECEILTIGVLPQFRNHGIGAALLEAGLKAAAERDAQTAFLEVNTNNSAALMLYRKLGFEAVGQRRNYYRNCDSVADALVMRRALNAWEFREDCTNVDGGPR